MFLAALYFNLKKADICEQATASRADDDELMMRRNPFTGTRTVLIVRYIPLRHRHFVATRLLPADQSAQPAADAQGLPVQHDCLVAGRMTDQIFYMPAPAKIRPPSSAGLSSPPPSASSACRTSIVQVSSP